MRSTAAAISVRPITSSGLVTTLRYSYMDVDDRISRTSEGTSEGTWVPRRWSQRHTVNAIVAWTRDDYTLAAALTWHTGWRTTVPPRAIGIDETLPMEQVLNNTELRDYLSLDISGSKSWAVGRSTVTVFADITNALDRNNVAGIDYWSPGT